MSNTTYNRRNREMQYRIEKNIIMKTIKKNREIKQKINIETYLENTKTKRGNMEKTDTIIFLKERNKN